MSISTEIWDKKYRFKAADGTPIDVTVQDTWRRIATALANAENAPIEQVDRFYDALSDYGFLPAGRITAGAGTGRAVTLFNCFVMGTIPDSMRGIFEMLKEAALTMQQGGGIGYDFSTIRPKGAPVLGVAADASGPLTFMDVWDAMCRTVMSAGSRRGAMMATMRCDHPDIEAFIEAKKDPAKLRMFNLSVLVTDAFMEAVANDEKWRLHFEDRNGVTTVERTVHARSLWEKIMRSTYAQAEPGVIFIDRINKTNNLNYCESIAATNPCGEQPLPPYGACLLGSINLAKLITNPFTGSVIWALPRLNHLVATAVRMMDNVIDVSNFPLQQQEAEAKAKRRIGLGVTGLADALMMAGVTYGSEKAVLATRTIMSKIAIAAYEASVDLAIEKGPFPLFDAEKFLAPGTLASTLPEDLQARIRKHGIRNSHLTSIAPTGTISLYAGNISSGIEPVFASSYTRKVLQKDGTRTESRVVDYAVALWESMGNEGLPPAYVDAQTLPPQAHLQMQSAAQKWIDSSISKTINLPEDISFEAFSQVYQDAYDLGCKGCTTYRPNDVTGSVLSVEPKKDDLAKRQDAILKISAGGNAPAVTVVTVAPRPDVLKGTTYKMKWPGADASTLYITINDDGDRPLELFLNTKNVENYAWMAALSRTVSAVFRRGGDVTFIAKELKEVFDPKGGAWIGGKYVPSMVAAIGDVILKHMHGLQEEDPQFKADWTSSGIIQPVHVTHPTQCPQCKEFAMIQQSGCAVCTSCGHSKCG